MSRPYRLLTVGHSYVVALNRRLPHELARAGAGRWDVTVAAPRFMHGDLRPIALEPFPGEAARLVPVGAHLTARPHVLFYGHELRRLFAEPWDLIHGWEEPFVWSGFQFARWADRRPLVYYTFQNIPKRYPPPFGRLERFALGRATAWLAAGHTVAAALRTRRGYADKPHRVIPLGVDTDRFRPDTAARTAIRRQLDWDNDGPPVVGFLGRLVPEKGLATLTAALDTLRTPWRALLVGSGPLEADLRRWANLHRDRVRLCTTVAHDQVPAYLNAMDLLAAPSQTTPRWKEQFGRMLIEAMACGVPVVGSDSGEIPYVVGDAGLIVAESDVAAWAQTVGRLLDSPALRTELAGRGRERVQDRYAWPIVARQHLDFFDLLMDSRSVA